MSRAVSKAAGWQHRNDHLSAWKVVNASFW
jgi:hypothetical protein